MQKRPGSTGAVTCSGVHERELAGGHHPTTRVDSAPLPWRGATAARSTSAEAMPPPPPPSITGKSNHKQPALVHPAAPGKPQALPSH